jgi:hypothetical protein
MYFITELGRGGGADCDMRRVKTTQLIIIGEWIYAESTVLWRKPEMCAVF